MYHCRARRIYRSGLQISDRTDPAERRVCISGKDISHKCGRLFSYRRDSGIGGENKLAESQSRTVFEGRDLRGIYDIFILCAGNRRPDRGWKNEACGAVCGIERGGRTHRGIRRAGNSPENLTERKRRRKKKMWLIFALLSAVFAALTSILAKVGIEGVNSNLATAIRTVVVVIMAWGMVFLTHAQNGISEISRKSWLFLILSGLATGGSWLCYYRALQLGEASKVVPIDKLSVVITLVLAFIFLHEQFTAKSLIGCVLIGAGTLLMVI